MDEKKDEARLLVGVSALRLMVGCQEGHLSCIDPISLIPRYSFHGELAYPGSSGKTAVRRK